MSEIQDAKEVGGGGGVSGLLELQSSETDEDWTKEAASKAQAIAATHALHAFRIPKGKE